MRRGKRRRPVARALAAAGVAAAIVGTLVAVTSSNAVPSTRLGSSTRPVTAETLKPAACAAVVLATVVVGERGTNVANLLLGGPGADDLRGRPGNDCILGGGGDDRLRGDPGFDVCIGGPGDDEFRDCEVVIQ